MFWNKDLGPVRPSLYVLLQRQFTTKRNKLMKLKTRLFALEPLQAAKRNSATPAQFKKDFSSLSKGGFSHADIFCLLAKDFLSRDLDYLKLSFFSGSFTSFQKRKFFMVSYSLTHQKNLILSIGKREKEVGAYVYQREREKKGLTNMFWYVHTHTYFFWDNFLSPFLPSFIYSLFGLSAYISLCTGRAYLLACFRASMLA